jgi:carbonic anhydrase/acetyltransferase-like protein (isoleucine patch superfamily)
MADTPTHQTDAQRFIDRLNTLDYLPHWTEAASLGVGLVDLSREELAIRAALVDLDEASRSFDAVVGRDLAAATDADLADHSARLAQIEARPGRYYLATGEIVQRDNLTNDAHQAGWWYDGRATLVTTPQGERIHHPGTHPDAAIHPTADIHPMARLEAGATIGPQARVGAHVHLARDVSVGAASVIQDGAWIGTNTQLGPHAWISHGATIEPHSMIGHHVTVGAGSRVSQHAQIEPYSRLGAGTTTSSSPTPRNSRGTHIATAIDNIMRLDRE